MSDSEQESDLIEPSKRELLLEYDGDIVQNKERIIQSAESVFDETSVSDKLEPFVERTTWILSESIENKDDLEEIVNTIINISLNYNPDVKHKLLDEEISESLVSLFEHISIHHGTELTKQANQQTIGDDWWNSISSTVTSKNGNTVLNFEFTVNLENKSTISTSPRGSHLIAQHILEQTKSARNIIGEDVYDDINREVLTDIRNTVEDLIEEYDKIESDNSSSVGEESESLSETEEF